MHTLVRAFAGERNTIIAKVVLLALLGVLVLAVVIDGVRAISPAHDSGTHSVGFHRGPAR
jgi:hypothetical protein